MGVEIIGSNSKKINKAEADILKRIIKSYADELPESERIENQLSGIKLRMNSYLNNDQEEKLVSTGEFLNEVLSIYGIKKNKFARYLDLEEPNLHALLKGRRKINNLIAKKIQMTFGIDEELWLFIETKNEIKKFNKAHKLKKSNFSLGKLVG